MTTDPNDPHTHPLVDREGYPDPYAIVEQHWPYDGPYSWGTTSTAAIALGRLVRYLNNATPKQPAMPYAADAGRVLSEVSAAVFGMQQLARQVAAFAERAADDPSLYDDRYDRPGRDTALEVAVELEEMQPAITDLAERLQRASRFASHLGNRGAE